MLVESEEDMFYARADLFHKTSCPMDRTGRMLKIREKKLKYLRTGLRECSIKPGMKELIVSKILPAHELPFEW